MLVEIRAASVTFRNPFIVENKQQIKPALPYVRGSDLAGAVQAVGEAVTRLDVGQHVANLFGA